MLELQGVEIVRSVCALLLLQLPHFVERECQLGISFVRVGCCVSLVAVAMGCVDGIARANRGPNEDVAIECVV